jgi:outer membrane lipoprotein-sorting protein
MMRQKLKLSRRGRWAVPAAVVVVTGGVIAGVSIPSAQAVPLLPTKTPAQLLAMVNSQSTVPPFTGTVVETTSLGLPQLPKVGDSTSITSLLTGSNTIKVYYDNTRHFRIAVPQTMSETDFIRNGSTLWQWSSTENSVTKYALPAPPADAKQNLPSGKVPMTPQQAANAVLAAVGKTTTVSVQSNVDVAGEAAYQLVLAPKDSRSLIGKVVIAVDGTHGVPLRVQVFAKGATTPSFQVGFTQISYVAPAAANLQFTPPPGATVKTENMTGKSGASEGANQRSGTGTGTYGSGWLTVAELPQSGILSSPSSSSDTTTPAGGSLGSDTSGLASDLLDAAKPVSGSWGSGSLLHTNLVNVLMVNGELYIGAVQPSVLYSAVEHGVASNG